MHHGGMRDKGMKQTIDHTGKGPQTTDKTHKVMIQLAKIIDKMHLISAVAGDVVHLTDNSHSASTPVPMDGVVSSVTSAGHV